MKNKSINKLINIKEITDFGIKITNQEYIKAFRVNPINISVLPYEMILKKINELALVIENIDSFGLYISDANEKFDEIIESIDKKIEKENNVKVRELLEKDKAFLSVDNIDVSKSRMFLVILYFWNKSEEQIITSTNRVKKLFSNNDIELMDLYESDIKKILALYFGNKVIKNEKEKSIWK